MSDELEWPFGFGMCCCGCGEKTTIASDSRVERGWVKGEPIRYIHGHGSRNGWDVLPNTFWRRVDRSGPDNCWNWQGCRDSDGYGTLVIDGRRSLAHRAAYILTYGEIQDGLYIRHLCNNPSCCNPSHLLSGTQQDNMDDMVRSGRSTRGERNPMARLSEWQVLDIYERCILGGELHREIAASYGVERKAVSDIFTGRNWAWLTGASREGD